ncbi:MAG: ORF6N domain-containing protein [Gammaproteobacteria bacterium]|nr:ORF6N domain-containing protein [Gammaproteobacteria bacterium]
MMQLITYDKVKAKLIEIRDQKVILDNDVAELYGVETKRINEAVSRNPEKFPPSYLIELTTDEWILLKSQIATSIKGGKVKAPIAFTERGLYMLATILKSPQAIKTTIAIIDTFAQIKELTQSVYQFSKATTDVQRVKIFENSTEIITNLLDNELTVSQHETSFKIKLPFFEITRKVTKMKK